MARRDEGLARGVGHGMTRKSTEGENEEILARAGFTTEATEGTKVFWRVARVVWPRNETESRLFTNN